MKDREMKCEYCVYSVPNIYYSKWAHARRSISTSTKPL
jgi:hypothetical protein